MVKLLMNFIVRLKPLELLIALNCKTINKLFILSFKMSKLFLFTDGHVIVF